MTASTNHSAYFVLSVRPTETSDVTLPFNNRVKAFAEGRNLVVTVLPVPALTGKARTFGAFGAYGQAELAVAQTPTDAEFRQLHLLGVAFQTYAMAGLKDFVGDIWTEKEHGGKEIIIPHVFIMRKLGPNSWSPGFYRSGLFEPKYDNGFYGEKVFNSLQQAADYLCNAVCVRPIDLSSAFLAGQLRVFPSTRERKKAYREVAKKLRQDGLKNVTKLRA